MRNYLLAVSKWIQPRSSPEKLGRRITTSFNFQTLCLAKKKQDWLGVVIDVNQIFCHVFKCTYAYVYPNTRRAFDLGSTSLVFNLGLFTCTWTWPIKLMCFSHSYTFSVNITGDIQTVQIFLIFMQTETPLNVDCDIFHKSSVVSSMP